MKRAVVRSAIGMMAVLLAFNPRPALGDNPTSEFEVENDTRHRASGLRVTLTGTGGAVPSDPKIVQDGPGCGATPGRPAIENGAVVVAWGSACVAPGDKVKMSVMTPFPGVLAGFHSWTLGGTLVLQPARLHSVLVPSQDPETEDRIFDDELAKAIVAAIDSHFKSVIFTFLQCHGGGFIDDLDLTLPANRAWSASSAASHLECSNVDGARDAESGTSGYGKPHTEALRNGKTARQAFDQALREDPFGPNQNNHLETPQYRSSGQPGDDIKVGVGAESYHAILFIGRVDYCAHWIETVRVYQMLRGKRVYRAEDIDVLFGDGTRKLQSDKKIEDCKLPDDLKNGVKPGDENEAPLTPATNEDLLETAIPALRDKFKATTPNGQLFFWAFDHGGVRTDADRPVVACAGAGLCATTVSLDESYFDMLSLSTTSPALLFAQSDIRTSTNRVFLNGLGPENLLGVADPTSPRQGLRFDPTMVFQGVNTILIVADNAGVPFELSDIGVTAGSSPGVLVPTVVTSATGSASRVGVVPSPGTSPAAQIRLTERFAFGGPVNLGIATVTIHDLLDEREGIGELVEGIPVAVAARSGGTATAAIFETPPGATPQVRVQVQARSQGVFDLALRVDKATLPRFPSLCAGQPLVTRLATRLTIDDGVNPPVPVQAVLRWRCLDLVGGDPLRPRSLRVP